MVLTSLDRRLLREAADLTDFFGHPLNRVHDLLLLMARTSSPPPEWLRGTCKLTHLPRYRPMRSGARISMVGLAKVEVAKRISWIITHQTGSWCVAGTSLLFATDRDAVHFRLRWSD